MRVQLLTAHNFQLLGGTSVGLHEGSILGPLPGDYPIGQISSFTASPYMLGLDGPGVAAVQAANGPTPLRGSTIVTTLAASAVTASGSAVLHFAQVPLGAANSPLPPVPGCPVSSLTNAGVIPASATVLSKTATSVTISASATGAGVAVNDVILFHNLLMPRHASPVLPQYLGGAAPNYATV